MLKTVRRKIANAIHPEGKSDVQTYPIRTLELTPAVEMNKSYLKLVHERFEAEHGRKAINDEEAWKYDRKKINVILRELELDEASTEFNPEHFGK